MPIVVVCKLCISHTAIFIIIFCNRIMVWACRYQYICRHNVFLYNYLRSICMICLKFDHSMFRYKNVWIDFRYFNHGRFQQKKIEALKVVILIECLFEVGFEWVLFWLDSLCKSLYVIGQWTLHSIIDYRIIRDIKAVKHGNVNLKSKNYQI